MKIKITNFIKIFVGTVLMAVALNSFFLPCRIASGGISGISVILKVLFNVPVFLTIIILNIPLFIVALKMVGTKFFLQSALGTVLFSLSSGIMKLNFSISDPVIASVIGGLLVGLGVGLILTCGATTGGTEIIAKVININYSSASVGKIIFLFDALVILLSGVIFKSIELSLYAALSVFISSKVIDYVVEGPYFSKCAFIISEKAALVSKEISDKLGRGVTGIDSVGMHTSRKYLMLVCAIPRREMYILKKLILSVDSSAFVIFTDAKEIYGRGFK